MTKPADEVLLPKECPKVWITRDSNTEGVLDNSCDLWLVRPIRHRLDCVTGAAWLPDEEHDMRQVYLGSYTLSAVLRWCRVLPDTDRECIAVGRQ